MSVSEPKLIVPKSIHRRELPLFKKEAHLIGWKIVQLSRRCFAVEGEDEVAYFYKGRKVWMRKGVYSVFEIGMGTPMRK